MHVCPFSVDIDLCTMKNMYCHDKFDAVANRKFDAVAKPQT